MVTKRCCRCRVVKDATSEFFYRCRTLPSGFTPTCKECRKAMQKEDQGARDRAKARMRRLWNENPKLIHRNQKKHREKLKQEMVAAYGGRCSCCGEAELVFLTLEHINGDGKEHRKHCNGVMGVYTDLKRRGWPQDGYTVLCFNCNCAVRNGKVCPHKRKDFSANGLPAAVIPKGRGKKALKDERDALRSRVADLLHLLMRRGPAGGFVVRLPRDPGGYPFGEEFEPGHWFFRNRKYAMAAILYAAEKLRND